MLHTEIQQKSTPTLNAQLLISIPTECENLVCELVSKLGGKVIENDSDEVITIPHPPLNEWPGRMVKGLRLREDMTQAELAKVIGVPLEHIAEYEDFTRPVPADKAKLLADALRTMPDSFLYRNESEFMQSQKER